MAAAITCRGLAKDYGRVHALGPLDLEVPAGSVFGLLGPNGAGKTTLLTLLAGLRRPTAGSADPGRRAALGYLEQDPRYYSWMTGLELLRMVGRLYGLEGRALDDAVGRACEITGLTEFAGRRIGGYSGGMQQRLGLAQAIVNRPAVLLLDEPVSSLDPIGRRDLLEIIAGLRGTTTVLLSTHILADVERVCDRVAILDRGRLLVEAGIEELLNRYATPAYEIHLEPAAAAQAAALLADLRAAPGIAAGEARGSVLVVRTDGSEAAARALLGVLAARGGVERLEKRRPSLEEVFLTLVGGREPEAA